jgi:hypothetical protein
MKNLRHIECTSIGYFLGINFTYYFSRRSSCCLELFYFQKELVTCVSNPTVNNIRKNSTAHNGEIGSFDRAAG